METALPPLGPAARTAFQAIRVGPGRLRPAPEAPFGIGDGRGPVVPTSASPAIALSPITSVVCFLEGFCFSRRL